jgi:hypothetical protein
LVLSEGAADVLASLASAAGTLSDRLNPSHPHFDAALKAKWKTFSKRERRSIVASDRAAIDAKQAAVASIKHPFQANPDDHCESPEEAYADAAPLLDALAARLGRTRATLRIYDPYFCAGGVKRRLGALGFSDVYNECEDFYAVAREGRCPEHDVVVTNPPYSGDHVERLLEFVQQNGRPFILLMPSYFCAKPYFEPKLGGRASARSRLAYLCPRKRYCYWTPKGMRGDSKLQKHHVGPGGYRTSPFVSFWYVDLSPAMKRTDLFRWWRDERPRAEQTERTVLCRIEDIPKSVRPEELRL